MTAETSNARGDAEYEYEVWQGDALQAGGSTTDYASAQSEAGHYAMMYASGGPVEVRIYEKRLLNAAPPPADAEPKTLPVPTRVYLTDKAAVIVGDPQRGWDEEGPDAHNCDAMGCASIGPHVLARVPFTDERALSQQPEARGGGEVAAWETEDGRVISARQKTTALRDGGASASSVAPYTTPLYRTAPQSAPVGVEAIAAEIRASLGRGATVSTRRRWAVELEALAQRPAAVDEAMVERAWVAFCENNGSARQGIRAALTAALAAQQQGGAE